MNRIIFFATIVAFIFIPVISFADNVGISNINPKSSGNVSTGGSALDDQVTIWSDPYTIEGDANFTWDGSTLTCVGDLSLDGNATFNDASADVDFRIESDNDDYAFFVQGSDGQVCVGTNTPSAKLDVVVADTENVVALEINQNDTTNNPIAVEIENTGSNSSLAINSTEFLVEADGTVSVAGVTNYETLVTADDDIPNKKYLDDNFPDSTEWLQNGIADITGSTIAFDDVTRVFTINRTGSSFDYYVQGIKYTVSVDDTPTINTVTLTDTDGQWYIYYDGATLTALNSPSHAQIHTIILSKCTVAMVYYDATNNVGILMDQRHGHRMAPTTHSYLHETVGMRYSYGLALGDFVISDGSDNEDAQFSIASGEVYDEDLVTETNALNATTGNIIFYRVGANWRWTTQTGFKCMTYDGTSGTRLAWDNAGTLTEVTDNKFVLVHIFATNASDGNPISIIGQNEYDNANAAREGAATEVNSLVLGSLPSEEMKAIGTVLFQTNDAYTNDVNAKIVAINGGNYVDWRTTTLSAGVSASEHGLLSGLADDDHVQYLLADASRDVTVADTENESFTINQNDVTNNPIALTIENTGTGNSIQINTNDFIVDSTGNISSDGNLSTSGQINSTIPATYTPSGTTETINWNSGNGQIIDLGSASGDVTLTLSNPVAGASYVLKVIQGATARDLVWPAAVKWQSDDAPIISTGNDEVDIIGCWYDGTNYYCNAGQDYQ